MESGVLEGDVAIVIIPNFGSLSFTHIWSGFVSLSSLLHENIPPFISDPLPFTHASTVNSLSPISGKLPLIILTLPPALKSIALSLSEQSVSLISVSVSQSLSKLALQLTSGISVGLPGVQVCGWPLTQLSIIRSHTPIPQVAVPISSSTDPSQS